MKNAICLAMITLISTLLTACSTFSREQCLEMDWRKQGGDTAMKGLTSEQGQAYFTRECKDVPVNTEQFSSGYKDMIPVFCTPENIQRFSENGGRYAETCPSTAVTPKFLMQYQSGREKFLEKRVAELEAELSDAESRASSLENEIFSLKSSPTCSSGE